MRAIWKGAINFGLVNIPVALFPATRREDLKFRLLRRTDLSPINYQRVAEVDGKIVPWEEIVKGYEYEKGKFVVLTEEDFKRVDVEATQTVDVMDFVDEAEIDPVMYQKPYYLEPQKGGVPAYRLLHGVLEKSGKVGITKVVIKTRQHLAALRARGPYLMLELMHFADELADPKELDVPKSGRNPTKREQDMARSLVEELTVEWDPERYTDDYESALMGLIKEKVKRGGKSPPKAKGRKASDGKVIDLVAVLQESLKQSKSGGKGTKARKKATSSKRATRKKPARKTKRAA